MKKELKTWEDETNKLAEYFSVRYFGRDSERYWIAEDVGGVLHINDYFFSLSDIVEFVKYHYSVKFMFEYYDYRMECHDRGESVINIKSWQHVGRK